MNENIISIFLFFTIDNFYDGQVRAGDFERQLCNLAGRQQVPHSLDQETKSESSGQLRIMIMSMIMFGTVLTMMNVMMTAMIGLFVECAAG